MLVIKDNEVTILLAIMLVAKCLSFGLIQVTGELPSDVSLLFVYPISNTNVVI